MLSLALIRYGLCVLINQTKVADLFVEERDCVVLFHVSRKIFEIRELCVNDMLIVTGESEK